MFTVKATCDACGCEFDLQLKQVTIQHARQNQEEEWTDFTNVLVADNDCPKVRQHPPDSGH